MSDKQHANEWCPHIFTMLILTMISNTDVFPLPPEIEQFLHSLLRELAILFNCHNYCFCSILTLIFFNFPQVLYWGKWRGNISCILNEKIKPIWSNGSRLCCCSGSAPPSSLLLMNFFWSFLLLINFPLPLINYWVYFLKIM